MLQYVATEKNETNQPVLQGDAVRGRMLQYVAVCCSMLQCAAVLHCVEVRCSVI